MALINGVHMRCNLCAAWQKALKDNDYAPCRRNPALGPSVREDSRIGFWVLTEKNDYCLQFVAET